MTASMREDDREWIVRAACRGHNADDWFPTKTGPQNSRAALAICMQCPVRFECKNDADSRNEPFGIWGGVARKGTALGSPHRRTQYIEQAPEDESPGVFISSQCMRCGCYWAHNAGPREHFSTVTKICPDCVALLPVLPWELVR